MYSVKLLTNKKSSTNDSMASTIHPDFDFTEMRDISDISSDEIKSISRIFEVICQLVHLKDSFLSQFCDAVTILPADELIVYLLNNKSNDENSSRIIANILAIIMCIFRELPENGNIVENIFNNSNFSFEQLAQHNSVLVRTRFCMLMRTFLRVCENSAQKIWKGNTKLKNIFEKLKSDDSNEVQNVSVFI